MESPAQPLLARRKEVCCGCVRRDRCAERETYLDPPYWGNEKDYGAELFDRASFERLAEQLASIKGRFLLTINDRPETRKLFGRFKIEAVQTTYTLACGQKAKRAGELIVEGP